MNNKRCRVEGEMLKPLFKSLWLIKAEPDITIQVLDFLFATISVLPIDASSNIEIEAKLGTIVDKRNSSALNLPILSETIINNSFNEFAFRSDMTLNQHARFNAMLNKLVHKDSKVRYVHTKEVDKYVRCNEKKVRVTTDLNGKVLGNMIKTRVADIEIYVPSGLDYRISVSIEQPVQASNGTVELERHKDRVSYTLYPFKIDLTQVTTDGSRMHELEVEFVDTVDFITQLLASKTSRRSVEFIETFLSNIRMLSRAKS